MNYKVIGPSIICLLWWLGAIYTAEPAGGSDKTKTEDEAKALTDEAYQNTKNSKSYQMTVKIVMEVRHPDTTIYNAESNLKAIVKNPTQGDESKRDETEIYVTGESNILDRKNTIEMYNKGKQMVAKDPANDRWQRTTETKPLFDEIEKLKNAIDSAKPTGEEPVNNIICQTIELTFNIKAVNKLMGEQNLFIPEDVPLKLEKIQGKVWVGKDDKLIYQMAAVIVATAEVSEEPATPPVPGTNPDSHRDKTEKVTMKVQMQFTFSDYGKNLEIKIPPEAKKLLETKREETPKQK